MRISDWSSSVCSSDLVDVLHAQQRRELVGGVLLEDLPTLQLLQLRSEALVLSFEVAVAGDAVPGVGDRGGHRLGSAPQRREDRAGHPPGGLDGPGLTEVEREHRYRREAQTGRASCRERVWHEV